jgi:plasmid stabilization system protein ParE
MRAKLSLRRICEVDMTGLPDLMFDEVVKTMEFLRDYPLGGQVAGIRGAKDIRRAVVKERYLIYYRYIEESNTVLVFRVRHGARKPPTKKDIFAE